LYDINTYTIKNSSNFKETLKNILKVKELIVNFDPTLREKKDKADKAKD